MPNGLNGNPFRMVEKRTFQANPVGQKQLAYIERSVFDCHSCHFLPIVDSVSVTVPSANCLKNKLRGLACGLLVDSPGE